MTVGISLRIDENDEIYYYYEFDVSAEYAALWNIDYCIMFREQGRTLFQDLIDQINEDIVCKSDQGIAKQEYVWYKDVVYNDVDLRQVRDYLGM